MASEVGGRIGAQDGREVTIGAQAGFLARRVADRHDRRMRRMLALFVASAIATTSVAAAESCPTMRAHALKHCCCPPSSQGHARLTCCDTKTTTDSRAAVRDRQEQTQVVVVPASASWSFVTLVPSLFVAPPSDELLASAAGPPPLTLRI